METEYSSARVTSYGNTPTLEIFRNDARKLERGEARLRVHYSSVSFVDLLLVQGKYQLHPSLPYVPGTEFSGTVDELSPDVTGISIGDAVCGISLDGGAWAEQIIVPASSLLKVPGRLSLAEAAAFPSSYETAYHAWMQRGMICPGETALVLGSSGMVGAAAVEIGRALGLNVLTLETRPAAGAENARDVVHAERGLREELEARKALPLDLVLDPIGGSFFQTCFRQLGWGGRYLVVGFAAGDISSLPMNLPLLKGCSLIGVNLREFLVRQPQIAVANRLALVKLVADLTTAPRLGPVFSLNDTTKAIKAACDRRGKGRVLISFQ